MSFQGFFGEIGTEESGKKLNLSTTNQDEFVVQRERRRAEEQGEDSDETSSSGEDDEESGLSGSSRTGKRNRVQKPFLTKSTVQALKSCKKDDDAQSNTAKMLREIKTDINQILKQGKTQSG